MTWLGLDLSLATFIRYFFYLQYGLHNKKSNNGPDRSIDSSSLLYVHFLRPRYGRCLFDKTTRDWERRIAYLYITVFFCFVSSTMNRQSTFSSCQPETSKYLLSLWSIQTLEQFSCVIIFLWIIMLENFLFLKELARTFSNIIQAINKLKMSTYQIWERICGHCIAQRRKQLKR